jgi:hypothetical protein
MQGVGNETIFINLFKQDLIKDIFLQDLNSLIENSIRASSYRLFSEFGFKEYL